MRLAHVDVSYLLFAAHCVLLCALNFVSIKNALYGFTLAGNLTEGVQLSCLPGEGQDLVLKPF
jgi:hypothetical protein